MKKGKWFLKLKGELKMSKNSKFMIQNKILWFMIRPLTKKDV